MTTPLKSPDVPEAPEALLQRLEWTVLRRLDGLFQGDYRSLFRGAGLDLAELREYQYHDDVRHIDWNVTARLQTPYIRQYHEDRETSIWFLLDLSPSMDFGSGSTSKRAMLVQFTALLGRLLARRGNRVGAMLYGGGVDKILRPASGRRHLLGLLQTLQNYPAPTLSTPTKLHDLLTAALAMNRRRSIVVLISDFISEAGWEKPLGHLAARHAMTAVRLNDPLELSLPDIGLLPVQDAETGEQIFVDTHDRRFRQRYEEQIATREASLIGQFQRAGVDVLELLTDDDLLDAMTRFIGLRSGRSGALANAPAPEAVQ